MINKLNLATVAAIGTTVGFVNTANAQTAVDVELALLLDSSGSISFNNFQNQLTAYQNVFTDPNFYNDLIAPFIDEGGEGQIAVSAYQFGSSVSQFIDWTLIDSQTAATDFGNAFMGITKGGGSTNMTSGINTAASGLVNNEFVANRLIIDISTDGAPNNRSSAEQASIDAISNGIDAINAIGVGFGVDGDYLQNSIVRGTNSFYIEVDDFDVSFQNALERKIEREISGGGPSPGPTTTPEPATMAGLLGFSFVGLVSRRRNKIA